jgi:hypothetical protein
VNVASTAYALQNPALKESNAFLTASLPRQVLLKSATSAGVILLAAKLSQTHPKAARVMLYSLSAITAGVAVRNFQITRGR